MRKETEIIYSINMLKYFIENIEEFDSSLPFVVTLIKFTSSVFVEVMNLLLLCSKNSALNCLWSFSGLLVLSDIDKLFFSNFKDKKLKSEVYGYFRKNFSSKKID